jgi:1,4-dihydroxy-2-naphthoate octaprenyltransferase
MGRATFTAWLYIMGVACVAIAIGDKKWGWLIGAVIFFVVAETARRMLKNEEASNGPARVSFVALAMLVMLSAMGILFWIQFRA